MKVLVTGVAGQLGYVVCRVLDGRGIPHQGVDIADFDITDREAVHTYLLDSRPDAVIHCSAWTAVDKAEEFPEQAGAAPKILPLHVRKSVQKCCIFQRTMSFPVLVIVFTSRTI